MVIKILCITFIGAYLIFNFITAKRYSVTEMWNTFVTGQCAVGLICANIFYAPAWVLKFLRRFINVMVK